MLKRLLIGIAAVAILAPVALAAESKANGPALLVRVIAQSNDAQLQLALRHRLHVDLRAPGLRMPINEISKRWGSPAPRPISVGAVRTLTDPPKG